LAAALPGLLLRGARIIEQFEEAAQNGLVLAPHAFHKLEKNEARRARWSILAQWAVALLLLWIVILLLR